MATNFRRLIEALAEAGVEFVVIGGVAVVAHGYPRTTLDLDICYARAGENLERLSRALAPFHPYLRGASRELPFTLDPRTLRAGLNFTLTTDLGDIDLLGEVTGVGGFAEASTGALEVELFGVRVKLMSLDMLEKAKRAAGRTKDLLDLEAIRRLKSGNPGSK